MKRRIIGQIGSQALLLLWTAITVVPFLLITALSFRPEKDIIGSPLAIGGRFTFDNFAAAWNGPPGGVGIQTYFMNSVVIAVVSLATLLCIAVPAGYFSTHLAPRQRVIFVRLCLVATVIPLVMLLIPYFQLFNTLNILNQPVALGISYGALSMPTACLILHAYFLDFPTELVEASQVDGLSRVATLTRIVVPLSRGSIFTVALITLVFVWGESQLGIVVLRNSESQSIPVGLLGFRGLWFVQFGPIFAGLALASLPIIAIYLSFHRTISKGIALGGVNR